MHQPRPQRDHARAELIATFQAEAIAPLTGVIHRKSSLVRAGHPRRLGAILVGMLPFREVICSSRLLRTDPRGFYQPMTEAPVSEGITLATLVGRWRL